MVVLFLLLSLILGVSALITPLAAITLAVILVRYRVMTPAVNL
jgi:hypothetical protein